ncbi:S8 family serine peptidase [Thalassotalea sp. Y01]|uniref:S8 family serine peptidase n=1 Tax=Thalassotalea sp. Y01 TaxID=2729613 RepID=UPI00145E4503|nr:S8 family serine peptidase [Thalassotalea sp. Y01]NMP14805.1 S8 family serine peptidase [Thalassotalea sp. Y01]
MKLNRILAAICAAGYSVGVGASVSSSVNDSELKPVSNQVIVTQQMLRSNESINSHGKINQIIDNAKQNKFVVDAHAVGEQTFVVMLKQPSSSHFESQLNTGTGKGKFANSVSAANLSHSFLSRSEYETHILESQRQLLSQINRQGHSLKIRHQFSKALNGFTIRADKELAEYISSLPDVAMVMQLGESRLQSYSTGKDIGADQIWDGLSDYSSEEFRGQGMVIGVLDTGINSDHPSFSDNAYDQQTALVSEFPVTDKVGLCAEQGDADERCNNKLIGIRSYQHIKDVTLGNGDIPGLTMYNGAAEEFVYRDGEDYNGHGSHVASLIAGNQLTDVALHYPSYKQWQADGVPLNISKHDVSGIAPDAQIISYQVCDPIGNDVSCPDEVVLQAIEDAINDDVDVINFSIAKAAGANQNPYQDAVELAFLNAHKEGIVVVTAVGNGDNYARGLGDHASPWLMSVGAADKSDSYVVGTAVTEVGGGDPETIPKRLDFAGLVAITEYSANTGYTGQSFAGNPVVAEAKIDTTLYSIEEKLNLSSCIDVPENVFASNEILVCLANEFANTDLLPGLNHYQAYQHMAEQAERAGAGGLLIVPSEYATPNLTVNYNNPDFPVSFMRSTPQDDSNIFYDWVLTSNNLDRLVEATINPLSEFKYPTIMGMMYTNNSAAGPGEGINGEYLLPSVVAPAVNVLAASADERPFNELGNTSDWLPRSGSSTAAAVVSGAAALVKQAHPEWSPSEVISALTLTAKPAIHIGNSNLFGLPDAYTMGAGVINVERAINTGLVMHESVENYLAADPNLHNVSDLNMPAVIERACYGQCSLTRTFKATRDGSWRSEIFMDYASATAAVTPASFSLKKGETIEIMVEFTVVDESARFGWDFDRWDTQYEEGASDIINNEGNLTGGDLVFFSEDKEIPEVHLPLAVETKLDIVNDMHRVDIPLNQGSKVLPLFTTDDVSTPLFTAYQPVLSAPVETDILPTHVLDDMSCYLYHSQFCEFALFDVEDHIANKTAHVEWLRVEEGSKRLFAEAQSVGIRNLTENRRRNSVKVAVGRDLNKNGMVDFREEILCISDFAPPMSSNDYTPGSNNFCSITDPGAGDYWVMYQWGSGFSREYAEFYKEQLTTTIKTHTGVVTGQQADNVFLTANTSTKEVTVHWDADLAPGETVFTAFNAVDNSKTVSLNLTRSDDVAVLTTNARAEDIVAGAEIDMEIQFKENLSDQNQSINLTTLLPEGVELVGSIIPETNSHLQLAVQNANDSFRVFGNIASAKGLAREYVITTSDNDDMCRTPDLEGQTHGKYLDLGLTPITGSAMRFDESSEEHYLLSPMAEMIISNPRRLREDGEPETDIEWAKRVHKDQWGPFNWMATMDANGQQYIDREHIVIDLREVFADSDVTTPWVSFFGNSDYARGRFMYMFGNGFIDFQNFAGPNPLGTGTPNFSAGINFDYHGGLNGGNLANTITPLWRAAGFNEQFITPFIPYPKQGEELSGISVGHVGSKLVVDYKNAQTGWKQTCLHSELIELEDGSNATQCLLNTGEYDYISNTQGKRIHPSLMEFYGNDRYNFQIFMETGEAKNRAGDYEVIIAYGDIKRIIFEDENLSYGDTLLDDALYSANIGLLGHEGYKNSYGGVYHGAEYYNSSKAADRSEIFNAVKRDKVVCFDYAGPSAKSGKVRFKVRLPNDAVAGQTFQFDLTNTGSNTAFSNSAQLVVAPSLGLSQLSDLTINEDSPTRLVTAALSDADVSAFVESSDRFIDAEAKVVGSQLQISISSDADYFTTSPATISVQLVSNSNSNDVVHASFEVNVTAINDAPELHYEQDSFSIMSNEFVELIAFAIDKDGDELTYTWSGEHIDESQINNASLNLSNLPEGEYMYQLHVTDGQVDVTKSFSVSVTQAEEDASTERKEPSGGAMLWLSLFTLLSIFRKRLLKMK